MRTGVLLLTLGVLLAALAVRAQQEALDDVEVHRVIVDPERLPAELARAKQGELEKMPRSEFEERLRRFRAARKSAPVVARLVGVRYHKTRLHEDAARRGEAYLSGSAEWTVLHPGPGTGVLPLQPLSLAFTKVRFENRSALVGDLDGEQPCLLLDRPGKQTVLVEWTARGVHTPEGILFNLDVPPAPLAQFELDLPAGRSLAVSPEGCVVEEDKSDTPDHRLWKVRFSGRSQLFLTVGHEPRATAGTEPEPAGPLVVDQVRSRHELSPEGEASEFAFKIRVSGRGVNSLTFACDPPLKPSKIALGPNDAARLERSELKEGALSRGRSALTLHFREPVSGVLNPRLSFRATHVQPRPEDRARPGTLPWACPRVSLQPDQLVPRSETIELVVPPQVSLERWQPGDFRVSSAETTDGTRALTLTGTGLIASTARPRALLRTQGNDYRARVLGWWQVGPGASRLDVQITFEIRQGKVFEVPVWVSPGWKVEHVSCSAPSERLRNWSVGPAPAGSLQMKGGEMLVVELQPPLETPARGEKPPQLSLRLRGPGPAGGTLRLPAILPIEAAGVDGGLGIDWEEEVHEGGVAVVPAGATQKPPREVSLPSDELPEEGPWGAHLPRHYLAWRDQPPQGSLRLRPRPTRTRARSRNDVLLTAGRIDVVSRLTLDVLSGAVDAIDLRLSTPLPPGVSLHVEVADPREGDDLRVRKLERQTVREARSVVGLLGASQPLVLGALLAGDSPVERWRAVLSRPVRSNETVTLYCQAPIRLTDPEDSEPAVRAVPLLTFAEGEGEVSIRREEPGGLAEVPEVVGLRPAPVGEYGSTLLYRHEAGTVALSLRPLTARGGVGPGSGAVLPRANLLTRIDPEGRLVSLYTFEVRDWPLPTLPLKLPPGARLAALRVDGRDASGLFSAESSDSSGVTLHVPIPRARSSQEGRSSNRVEVLYAIDRGPCLLAARLEAPRPITPLEPLILRRTWRLPAGIVPVSTAGLLRLPGGSGPGGLAGFSLEDGLSTWTSLMPPALALDRWESQQEQAVRSADQRFRREAGGQSRTLEESLRQLASGGLAEQGLTLVLDAGALAEAGLHPGRLLSVPQVREDSNGPALGSLTGADLIYVPCKAAPLVTTRRQWMAWQRMSSASSEGDAPAAVRKALSVAVENGHDESGRFRTVPAWLEAPSLSVGRTLLGPALEELTPADELAGWTDWQATPGAGDSLWVVQARAPAGAGLVLVLLLLVAVWVLRRRPVPRQDAPPRARRGALGALLVWLGLTGAGVVWLPAGLRDLAWWPLAAGVLVALAWYLSPARSEKRKPAARPSTSPRQALPGSVPAVGALLLFWGTWIPGPAAPPALSPDSTVYLIPGKEGTGEEMTALVPPALLRKLDRRPEIKSLAEAVLVSAEYQATARPGSKYAQVEATLQVWCPGPGPATLTLLLDGSDLRLEREPLLDGAPAAPAALARGYAVRVAGAGLHKLQLSFRTEIRRNGELHELQFTAPRVADSRLSLRLPQKDLFVQSLNHLGSQRVSEDDKGTLLEVEIGAVILPGARRGDASVPLHLHWAETRPGKAVPVKVREAYLWDLGQRGHSLAGVVLFDVGPGMTDRLVIDVPAELMISKVEASRPQKAPDAGMVRLRDWRLTSARGKVPQLLLDFQSPVSGRVQVVLDGYPRANLFAPGKGGTAPTATLILPVPRPHGQPIADEGFLAYRLSGLETEHGQILRLVGLREPKLPDFFWEARSTPVRRDVSLRYACRILRQGDQGPVLPLTLHVVPSQRTGSVRLTWRVGATLAEVRAAIKLEAQAGDLALVECDVPAGVEVTAVQGTDVREWTSLPLPGGGQRLQVWLLKTVRTTSIEVRGTAPVARLSLPERRWYLVGGALSNAMQRGLSQAGVFNLPALRIHGLEQSPTTLEVIAAGGLALTPQWVNRLSPAPVPEPRERWLFESQRTDHAGRFVISVEQPPSVRIITFVEMTDREMSLRTRIEPLAGGDGLRSVRAQVRGWPGKFRLDAPGGQVRSEVRGQGASAVRAWEVRRDVPDRRALTIAGTATLDELQALARQAPSPGGLPLPDVEVSGATCVERVLVLDTSAARFELRGPEASVAQAPVPWPEAEQVRKKGGHVWRLPMAGAPAWLTERGGVKAALHVVAREHVAAVLDERRWTYQSTWWLFHDGPVELTFTLPAGTIPAGLSVDGVPHSLPAGRPVAVSLKGTGARRVCLRWTGPDGQGGLTTPSPEAPQLQGDPSTVAVVRTVYVPPSYRMGAGSDFRHGATAGARVELERAAAQERLAGLLQGAVSRRLPRSEAQLSACRQRLSRHLWNAGQLLSSAAAGGSSQESTELSERLQSARERAKSKDLLPRPGRDPVATEGGDVQAGDDLERVGQPLYRVDAPGPKPAGAPSLVSEAGLDLRRALGATGLLTCLLMGVWVLSSFETLTRLARFFWPEQAVFLGLVGLQALGPTWPVIFLLALGAVARVLFLGSALVSLVQRWRPAEPQRA